MNIKISDEGLQHLFQTCDLALAATLSFFCLIERIDRTNPKRAYFIFKKNKDFRWYYQSLLARKNKSRPAEIFSPIKTPEISIIFEYE